MLMGGTQEKIRKCHHFIWQIEKEKHFPFPPLPKSVVLQDHLYTAYDFRS